eukprot:592446-Pleurochrysis_carterae.AAC.1
MPEYRPYEINDSGQLQTIKSGVRFMHEGKLPDINIPASRETWKAAELNTAEGDGSGAATECGDGAASSSTHAQGAARRQGAR